MTNPRLLFLPYLFIALIGCSLHSSEYSNNPPKPLKWGHHYDSVYVAVTVAPNISRYYRASKHVLDSFAKQYDTTVYKYAPWADSVYNIFVKGGDTVKDTKGNIVYDTLTKKPKISKDQTYQAKGLVEVPKSFVDTAKLR